LYNLKTLIHSALLYLTHMTVPWIANMRTTSHEAGVLERAGRIGRRTIDTLRSTTPTLSSDLVASCKVKGCMEVLMCRPCLFIGFALLVLALLVGWFG